MNKAKLFLTAIGVFAIVGGALAYKAKSTFGAAYCYTTAASSACSQEDNLTPAANGSVTYFYTLKGEGACNSQRTCATGGSRKFNID